MDFGGARDYIIQRLRLELKPTLYYHSVEHTIDVHEATKRLIAAEHIADNTAVLIETAALYHDAGILFQYTNHECASVELSRQKLPGFGYSPADIDFIAEMIMVTSLPQRPSSLTGQILCDADLDYLGREDFFIHSFQLRLEWQIEGIKNLNLHAWLQTQVSFLSDHQYFTNSAIALRNEQKNKNLLEIKQLLSLINH
jgi:uncharacterized protein